MESTNTYEGDNFDEWLTFARLQEEKLKFRKVGIEDFESLCDGCQDIDSILTIRETFPPLNYYKFKNAIPKSKQLDSDYFIKVDSVLRDLNKTINKLNKSDKNENIENIEITMQNISLYVQYLQELLENTSDINKTTRIQNKLSIAHDLTTVLTERAMMLNISNEKKKTESIKQIIAQEKLSVLEGLEEQIRESYSVDICFVLDCTGSMRDHIKSMQQYINTITNSIRDLYIDMPFRLAFVGYRDHCDGDDRLSVFEFSNNVTEFQNFVGRQVAKGGGDFAEDVLGALERTLKLSWASNVRLLYHICDAPCHGRRYHNTSITDSKPGEDSRGLSAENLIPNLINKNIQYTFGKIFHHTDKMIEIFNQVAEENSKPSYIQTFDARDSSNMMELIAASVSISIYKSLSSSATTDKNENIKEIVIDRFEPLWPTIGHESVLIYSLNLNNTNLSELANENPIYLVPEPIVDKVKVGKNPFNQGNVRAVFKAKSSNDTDIVHKIQSKIQTEDLVRQTIESKYIAPYWAATILAINFEAIRPAEFPSIRYVPISLVQYLERSGTPYCSQEPFIQGHFEKFNNNTGIVLPNPSPRGTNHDIIQAFSHWSYLATDKRMIVVDCQGFYNRSNNCFILTDPAIHSVDPITFGGTNLHKTGINRFIKSHRCNDCCRTLGLTPLTLIDIKKKSSKIKK